MATTSATVNIKRRFHKNAPYRIYLNGRLMDVCFEKSEATRIANDLLKMASAKKQATAI